MSVQESFPHHAEPAPPETAADRGTLVDYGQGAGVVATPEGYRPFVQLTPPDFFSHVVSLERITPNHSDRTGVDPVTVSFFEAFRVY